MATPISPLAQSIINELKKIRLDRIDLNNPLDRLLFARIIDGETKRFKREAQKKKKSPEWENQLT